MFAYRLTEIVKYLKQFQASTEIIGPVSKSK